MGCYRTILQDSNGTYLKINGNPMTYDDPRKIYPMDGLVLYHGLETVNIGGDDYIKEWDNYLWPDGGDVYFHYNTDLGWFQQQGRGVSYSNDYGIHGEGAYFYGDYNSALFNRELFNFNTEQFIEGTFSIWFKVNEPYYNGYKVIMQWDNKIRLYMDENYPTQLKVDFLGIKRFNVNITDNKWHHVVLTWSNISPANIWLDGKDLTYYQNSGELITVSYSGSVDVFQNTNNTPFVLGDAWSYISDGPQSYHYFYNYPNDYIDGNTLKGNIDEVGLWNRQLSECEVETLWNNGTGWFRDDVWQPLT